MQVFGIKKYLKLVPLVLAMTLNVLVAQADAQRGGEGRSGMRKPGGGRGGQQSVQQKPGKPAEERVLRVCRALSLSENQLEAVKAAYDSMEVNKQEVLEEQRIGAISSLAARKQLNELGKEFETKFISLLDEKQCIQMEKLREEGVLGEQWW